MPRFYDDYSNTYLTHDSAAGRKQQRRGWKFRENFKLHYEKHLGEWRKGPNGLAAAQQAVLKSNPSIAPPLPAGWVEENDEATGAMFYYHEESGRRTWVRPGFRPPPAGAMSGPPSAYSRPPPNFPPRGPPPQFQMPPPNMSQPPPSFPPPGMPPPGVPPPGMPPQFRPPPGVPPPNLSQPPIQFPPPRQFGQQH